MKNVISSGERVLITGGTGSLGVRLLDELTQRSDIKIVVFSRDEKKQYDLRQQFPTVEFRLGDLRDKQAVRWAVLDSQVVIHAAALKYIDVSEKQPTEYVQTNIIGTMNLLEAISLSGSVRRCVGISSDKACRPVNTYGLTKALLEKLFLEAAYSKDWNNWTQFTIARYGNVIGTRGSVVPFWAKCRAEGKPLPVTDPTMTRFFFTLDDAVNLLGKALSVPGGTMVSQAMTAVTLGHLAGIMATPAGLEYVGRRPGEKQHEELLTEDEMGRCTRSGDYFLHDPNARGHPSAPYTSDVAKTLTSLELIELLKDYL